MKLLVVDYDGTFKSNIKNLNINIKKINEFMKKGNKFVIATGREYKSLKDEINFYDIKYDYIICNNGLVIFDNMDNIVYINPLIKEELDFIYKFIKKEDKLDIIKLYNAYSSTVIPKDILEVLAVFETIKTAKKVKKELEKFKNELHCYQFEKSIFIGKCSTKATAIKEIEKIEDIKKEDIYTVGNDINDIEMLKEYNGYKMLNSNKQLLFQKIPIVRQVHTLAKKLIKDTK